MEGWIRLYRKIRTSLVFNNPELLRLWLICLLEATHTERQQLIGMQSVNLMPGEFVTGRFALADMFNSGLKPSDRKSPVTIWKMLERLKSQDFLIINSNNKFTVVSVTNWLKYQSSDLGLMNISNNKRSTSDQQTITNNNVNNDKNEKNKKRNEVEYSSDFLEFWDVYPKRIGKVDSYREWQRLINNGMSPEILKQCGRNYASHCSDNNTDPTFIKHPDTFLRSERFKDYEHPVQIRRNQSDKNRPSVQLSRNETQGGVSQTGWERLIVGKPNLPMQ